MNYGKKGYEDYKEKGEKYVNDKYKAKNLLDRAIEKAEKKKGPIKNVWEELQLMFSVAYDWVKGNYKDIPIKPLTMIFVAILYFVTPTDIVPDVIPLGGFVDDVAVIAYVLKDVRNELHAYKEWKKNNDEEKKSL
ncbi:MAG: YkvA family protein [Candidatus Woesearchaeota archaeon]